MKKIFAPYAPKVKGTIAVNGTDESDADFIARKDKGESEGDFLKRYFAHLETEIESAKSNNNDELKKELEDLKTSIADDKKSKDFDLLKEEIKKHGLALEAMKEAKVIGDRDTVKGSIMETLKKNDEKIKAFMSRKSGVLEIEHKSYTAQTSTDITSRGDTYFTLHEGGAIGQIPVRQPFIRECFKNQNSSSEYIKYMDQATVARTAANVALCAASNSTTKLTWAPYSVQISKIRDLLSLCSDMMTDYSFVDGEIRNLINSSLALKIDDQLLVGTGAHPELNSLTSNAYPWAATISGISDFASSIASANLVNLLAITKNQINQLGQLRAWTPNYAFVNPGDHELMMHLKNTFGDTVKFYPGMFVDNMGNIFINGMRLIPNPNIAANTFWMGDFTKGTVYAIPGIGIEFSYENSTNFETETVTVKAYERLNLLIRNVDKNAFCYCSDINAAVAAITKV